MRVGKKRRVQGVPTLEQLELELQKEQHKNTYRKAIRSTIYTLLVVAAVAVIIAVMIFPVLRIEGTSMTETLWEKDIVVAVSGSGYKTGDIIAFYYNNKILVKRVIAVSGDWVDLDAAGNVSVNGVWLEEPYLTEKALGTCDITLPYQVPEGRIFVMGDHRATSLDSRTTEIGCIGEELIVGRILLRIWPFSSFGTVK
ncbi:MAG: signal peptidase I [Lachnospiraceae bacterium]|jgi:signal peptidase I|nr:signal peptidase I [Lachnospiraceae bacterium]